MSTFAKLKGSRLAVVVVADTNPDADEYIEVPDGVKVGWVFDGVNYTGPGGESYETINPYLLTNWEWRFRFNDTEWDWLIDKRDTSPPTASSKRLGRLLDAILTCASVSVQPGVSSEMDEFYTWLLNQGIPGGQSRIDELREAKSG